MGSQSRKWYARSAHWWIRANPTYLLSAAAMALGARWYLVVPNAPAGEVGRILLTFGVLQAYELAVCAALIALHRARRSPEDQPSLLLVAALFWTGPMAATVEMTARDATAGMGFALVACLLALGELQTVRRAIGLRLSPWAQAAASACVILVAAIPGRLRLPHAAAGTDEVLLYLSWWVLGGVMLAAIGGLRWHGPLRQTNADAPRHRRCAHIELAFLGMVFAATAAHLWAMNYAFFGHARFFYVTPVLAAATITLFEYLARRGWRAAALIELVALPPAGAIVFAFQGFADQVDTAHIALPLRDPLLAALVCAAGAWWYGYARLRVGPLLHAGALALLLATIRGAAASVPGITGGDSLRVLVPASRGETAMLLAGLAVYLWGIAWLRRSRVEAVAAIVAQWAAFAVFIHGQTPADVMSICLLGGWSWLAAVHVVWRRPTWRATIWPVSALALATGGFALRPGLALPAACHAAGMVALLIGLGWLWPWTRYRTLGMISGSAYIAGSVAWRIASARHPKAAAAVLAAFVLLAAGMVLSWNKHTLLQRMRPRA